MHSQHVYIVFFFATLPTTSRSLYYLCKLKHFIQMGKSEHQQSLHGLSGKKKDTVAYSNTKQQRTNKKKILAGSVQAHVCV